MNSHPERLTVLDNPRADRVRRVSGLVGRSARSRSGLMLVEGPQAVRELARFSPGAVRDVYVRSDAWETHADVVDAAMRATRWVHPVTDEVSAALSRDSQGICAVASLGAVSRELPPPSEGETLVVLAQGRDPGNVGTIIRTADAFGACGVIAVAGTVDATSPKVVRASAGLLGTSGGAGSLDLSQMLAQGVSGCSRLSQSHAWVFGNEAKGLSGAEMRLCDALVSIPMTGDAESLNVASAAATCLFASQTVRGLNS